MILSYFETLQRLKLPTTTSSVSKNTEIKKRRVPRKRTHVKSLIESQEIPLIKKLSEKHKEKINILAETFARIRQLNGQSKRSILAKCLQKNKINSYDIEGMQFLLINDKEQRYVTFFEALQAIGIGQWNIVSDRIFFS